jgi:hypothetical protein
LTRKADRLYYSAEAEAGVQFLGAFSNDDDARLYLRHVQSRSWWKELTGEPEIELRYIRRVQYSGTHRYRGKFYVDLSLGRLHEGILLHELAHVPTYVPDVAHNDHGVAFARAHLTILDNMVDRYLVVQFRHALEKRGILPPETT